MSGVYVACFLDPDTANRFAVDNGQPAESLHVTLAAFGDLDPDQTALVQQAAAQLAFQQSTLTGNSPGFGVFRNATPTEDVFFACVDLPGLFQLRDNLIDNCCAAGIEPLTDHDYTPHLTLAYFDASSPVMIGPSTPEPLTLTSLAVCSPDDDPSKRQNLPFLGVYIGKDEPSGDSDTHVDVPLGASRPKKKRKEMTETPPLSVSVIKADDEQQILGGIVLQPVTEDSQGDIVTIADIEKAAHRFLYERTPIGLQHATLAPDDVRPVESYLAPVDFIADTPRGPELVRKGSWIVACHIPDPQLWQFAKQEFTGWSIAGTGHRTPLNAETPRLPR